MFMTTGPILGRELITVARRAKSYRERCSLAIALLLAIGLTSALVQYASSGQLSIHQLALFAQYLFGTMAAIQVVLTLFLVPASWPVRLLRNASGARSTAC